MSSHCQRSHEDRFRGYVHDAENRLVSVSGGATASFVYDGDNQRVKGTAGGVTTVYVGNYYEVAGSTVKKYYYAGNQRVAMKSGTTVNWLLGDHLGSTAYTINGTTETGEVRYYAWGKDRYTSGTTPTSYKFTGQREEASLGLYYYGARWYDRTAGAKHHPALGRFIGSPLGADTVVPNPGDTQSFDHVVGAKRHRYAYVNNNPLKYVDPTGHEPCPSGNWGDCRPQLGKLESNRLAQYYHDLGVSWTAVPGDAKAVLTAQGETEGSYSDLGPGATVQTGLKDPATVAASLFGIGRLVWRLPILLGACMDDGCETEYRTYDMAVKRFDPSKAAQQFNELLAKGVRLTDHALREAQKDEISSQKIADTFNGMARNTQYFWDGSRVAQWSPHTNVALIIERGTKEVVTVFARTSPQISWQAMTAFEIIEWLKQ
ncbi:MAG: RHS repeat-associated core domain-containing protein [Caldilineaceae bacterium]